MTTHICCSRVRASFLAKARVSTYMCLWLVVQGPQILVAALVPPLRAAARGLAILPCAIVVTALEFILMVLLLLAKFLATTFARGSTAWRHYCTVLGRGARTYNRAHVTVTAVSAIAKVHACTSNLLEPLPERRVLNSVSGSLREAWNAAAATRVSKKPARLSLRASWRL